ncbi:MAG TPA: neutral zinc metallopeptidase [Gemmatimonadales bacterium]|nr:neutral zinc metallopeptidase [Gemmatimonadales bacterium]
MRWDIGNRSSNLEDRRGQRAFGGLGVGRLGIGGVVILLVLSLIFKKDFFSLVSGGEAAPVGEVATTPEEEKLVDFVSFVFDTAQSTWARLFEQRGQRYQDARIVLFRDAVNSACGFAESATGPFYCPGDSKVYIDLGFYEELRSRFGAPGDFAQAYVLAHEVGHHVQSLIGDRFGPTNEGSVRRELQADCFAGVWGYYMGRAGVLESGDVEEGLGAASAIGDDRLQRMSTGTISPESFTHGSSAQRREWLRRGLESGRMEICET